MLRRRCLCDEPIPRPEKPYRVRVSLRVIRCNSNRLHLTRSKRSQYYWYRTLALQGEGPATKSLSPRTASKREIQLNNTYAFNSYPVIRTFRLKHSDLLRYTRINSPPHRRPQTPTISRDMQTQTLAHSVCTTHTNRHTVRAPQPVCNVKTKWRDVRRTTAGSGFAVYSESNPHTFTVTEG